MRNIDWLIANPEEFVRTLVVEVGNCGCCVLRGKCDIENDECEPNIEAWLYSERTESPETGDVPIMVQTLGNDANGTSEKQLCTADDEFDEREMLRRERDFWRCRCGQLLDAISVAGSIACEWDEEA